jgi:hypothetical protein
MDNPILTMLCGAVGIVLLALLYYIVCAALGWIGGRNIGAYYTPPEVVEFVKGKDGDE